MIEIDAEIKVGNKIVATEKRWLAGPGETRWYRKPPYWVYWVPLLSVLLFVWPGLLHMGLSSLTGSTPPSTRTVSPDAPVAAPAAIPVAPVVATSPSPTVIPPVVVSPQVIAVPFEVKVKADIRVLSLSSRSEQENIWKLPWNQ